MKLLLVLILSINALHAFDIIIDNHQHLMWQNNHDVEVLKMNFEEATLYCDALVLEKYDDWRLPHIQELQSIVNVKEQKPAINSGFLFTGLGDYWSSTERATDAYSAWVINFTYGYTDYSSTLGNNYIRCVR